MGTDVKIWSAIFETRPIIHISNLNFCETLKTVLEGEVEVQTIFKNLGILVPQ